MRKLLFVIAAAGLLLVALAPIAAGDDDNEFRASLNGYLEVPSISTAARGSFRAELRGGNTLHYRLTIRDFSEDPLFAHIHFARPDVVGGVIAFLCGGGGKPVCPANGTVTGTVTAADVIGPGRGLTAGEFGELIKAMRNGATYANVHSPTYQPGEIRGNIRRGD
jgi:CHRD domain-containing protein